MDKNQIDVKENYIFHLDNECMFVNDVRLKKEKELL